MKRATLNCGLIGIVLLALASGLFIYGGTASANCVAHHTSCGTSVAMTLVVAFLATGIGIIFSGTAWVLGLAKTVLIRRWGWFAVVLLLSPFGATAYGAFGPEHPAEAPVLVGQH